MRRPGIFSSRFTPKFQSPAFIQSSQLVTSKYFFSEFLLPFTIGTISITTGCYFMHAFLKNSPEWQRQARIEAEARENEAKIKLISDLFGKCDSNLRLSNCEISTLIELQKDGLTPELLKEWKSGNTANYFTDVNLFCEEHKKALIYLIRKRGLTPENAIKEINELSPYRAEAIASGFSRSDVMREYYQLATLLELSSDGLTGEHLGNWKGQKFSDNHQYALIYLMRTKHLSPDAAIAEINELNSDQAGKIRSGLSRDEVLGQFHEAKQFRI